MYLFKAVRKVCADQIWVIDYKDGLRRMSVETIDRENGNFITELEEIIERKLNPEEIKHDGDKKIEQIFEEIYDLDTSGDRVPIIHVNKEGKIIFLNLKGKIVHKRIPSSIENLGDLHLLDLRDDELDAFPETLGNLTKLECLLLYDNQFSPDGDGFSEVPECIKNMKLLKMLDLSFNYLKKIPDWIGSLSNLEKLWVSHNYLTEIPLEIKYLNETLELDLSYNYIDQVPEEIINRFEKIEAKGNPFDLLFKFNWNGEKELKQHAFLTTLNEDEDLQNDFWKSIYVKLGDEDLENLWQKQEWTVILSNVDDEKPHGKAKQKPLELEGEDVTPKDIHLKDRTQTELSFRCEVDISNRSESYYHFDDKWRLLVELIDNITVRFETDFGDHQDIQFTDFIYDSKKNRFVDHSVVKIDEGYSNASIAHVRISHVTINCRESLKKITPKQLWDTDENENLVGKYPDCVKRYRDHEYDNCKPGDIMERFQRTFKHHAYREMRYYMGNFQSRLGRYIEYMQSKLIFAGLIPPAIVFILNLLGYQLGSIYFFSVSLSQIVSYAPLVLIGIIFTIKYLLEVRDELTHRVVF